MCPQKGKGSGDGFPCYPWGCREAAFFVRGGAQPLGAQGFRPAERARAFRSPLQPSGVPCRWLFLRCGALPLGRGFAPAGASKGFPLALATFGFSLQVAFFALRRTAARKGSALRGGQGLSARPCNLRVSPSMAAGTVRGVALDVQESRPALRRRPTSLSACGRPLTPPALLYSGDRGGARGFRPAGRARAFRSPLQPSGAFAGFFCALRRTAAGEGFRACGRVKGLIALIGGRYKRAHSTISYSARGRICPERAAYLF